MKTEPLLPATWEQAATEAKPLALKFDSADVNQRILERQKSPRYRSTEGASIKMTARFVSPDGKRLFVRLFQHFQINVYYISMIARTRMADAEISQIEAALRDQIDSALTRMNAMIDEVDHLLSVQGITHVASYESAPLWIEVGVSSSLSRRYLELLEKMDQVMPLLNTLEICDVWSVKEVDRSRLELKRLVKRLFSSANRQAQQLRRLPWTGAREGPPREDRAPVTPEPKPSQDSLDSIDEGPDGPGG